MLGLNTDELRFFGYNVVIVDFSNCIKINITNNYKYFS